MLRKIVIVTAVLIAIILTVFIVFKNEAIAPGFKNENIVE